MNVELLEKIKEQIRREPNRFFMSDYFCDAEDVYEDLDETCGTAACICGWAIFLKQPNALNAAHEFSVWEDKVGADFLGLTKEQASRLFNQLNWPEKFGQAFHRECGSSFEQRKENAEIACARIDHFIATNGDD